MTAQRLILRKAWVRLEGTAQGVRLQLLSGTPFYYRYAQTEPYWKEVGFQFKEDEDKFVDLEGSPLSIWVKSTEYTVIEYTPRVVTDEGSLSLVIGDLTDLETVDKTSLVGAINELNQRIDDFSVSASAAFFGDFVLSASDISGKQLMLPFTPIPETLQLDVYGGIRQRRNVDFIVSGNVISWGSLALEMLVEQDSVLSIQCIRG
jgi:hypothetical protein